MNPTEQHVFIVDDDDAIRSSLSMLLESYGYRTESYSTAEAFLQRCEQTLPDARVLLLDLSMPGLSGLDLQAMLHRLDIDTPVVFLSGEGDVRAAVRAVQQGAIDFIEKPVDTDLLVERLREAFHKRHFDNDMAVAVRELEGRLEQLTPREKQVLDELAAGRTSKTIAGALELSQRTVELHRSRVLKKMGARNCTELLNQLMPLLHNERVRNR